MVVECILLVLAPASLSGVPSGTARFVLPDPAASNAMRPGIFKYSFSKISRQILPISTLCCSIPNGCSHFVPIKSFERFAARFLGITLLDLNDGRRVLQSFHLQLRQRHLTKTRGQGGNAGRTRDDTFMRMHVITRKRFVMLIVGGAFVFEV